jgi:hypothetical protein
LYNTVTYCAAPRCAKLYSSVMCSFVLYKTDQFFAVLYCGLSAEVAVARRRNRPNAWKAVYCTFVQYATVNNKISGVAVVYTVQ